VLIATCALPLSLSSLALLTSYELRCEMADRNHKFRAMLKSLDKANAWGDGKWVDDFKIAKKQG
jgi:hypothetical protein